MRTHSIVAILTFLAFEAIGDVPIGKRTPRSTSQPDPESNWSKASGDMLT
jgi:hypothetical protein